MDSPRNNNEAFASLSDEQQRILSLRLQGHSAQEIADELGIGRGRVKYQLALIVERLGEISRR